MAASRRIRYFSFPENLTVDTNRAQILLLLKADIWPSPPTLADHRYCRHRDLVMTLVTRPVPEKDIKEVKYLIESCQLVRALRMISILQSSEYQSAASVLALKALAYTKTGITSEALSICEKLFSDDKFFSADTTDDLHQVLNTLQKVCHLLGKDDLATAFFKKACSAVPSNLDLMKGLFYCYQLIIVSHRLWISLRSLSKCLRSHLQACC